MFHHKQEILDKHFKRRPRNTLQEKIFHICEESLSAGNNITVRYVRQVLGKGSHTTISKYIKLWRAQRRDKYELNFANENLDFLMEEMKKHTSKHSEEDVRETVNLLMDQV